MTDSFFPYTKQSISENDIQAVKEALKENWITRGPLVEKFEKTVADYCEVPYAVAFSSGTAALMAAYFATRLSPFDQVISSPNTFIATIGTPIKMGIRPKFVDLDRTTGNFDLNQLQTHLEFRSSRGRLFIVPIHFSGIAINMEKLDRLIQHPNVVVIEDASHALGSFYPSGQKVGCCLFSHITIFSFHPAKIITTGEGGMAMTRDPELYHYLKLFRDNGIEKAAPFLLGSEASGYYEVHAITGNFNFTSFQSALGISQMEKLEKFISKRRLLVNRYRHNLQKIHGINLFMEKQDTLTAFALFVTQINFKEFGISRQEVMQNLKNKGIGTQVHYIPLYHHPVLKKGHLNENTLFPETESYYQNTLSLPLYYDLNESDVDSICDELLRILKKAL